jgi:hypothetical protein
MKIRILLLLISTAAHLSAQPPDLDTFSRDVDLSTLNTPAAPQVTPEANPDVPPTHLFAGFESLPPLPEPAEEQFQPVQETELSLLRLPAAGYLVVPNPPRIDMAYARLAQALAHLDQTPAFPLKVVLHADEKFSVAIALPEDRKEALPLGVDLSPLPAITLLGLYADIQLLRKDQPPVLEAYQTIRLYARSANVELDAAELYAIPLEPGRVFFALRIKNPPRTGDFPVHP